MWLARSGRAPIRRCPVARARKPPAKDSRQYPVKRCATRHAGSCLSWLSSAGYNRCSPPRIHNQTQPSSTPIVLAAISASEASRCGCSPCASSIDSANARPISNPYTARHRGRPGSGQRRGRAEHMVQFVLLIERLRHRLRPEPDIQNHCGNGRKGTSLRWRAANLFRTASIPPGKDARSRS